MDKNGKKDFLQSLLSEGDTTVKLVTLAMVIVSGGGNFFATKQAAKLSEHEAQQAVKELHEVHAAISEASERQKKILELLEKKNGH